MISRRTILSSFAAVAIVAGVVVPAVGDVRTAGAQTSGTVSGQVFQDFDSDGEFDTTVAPGQATDLSLEAIEVRAYDGSGQLVGSDTTAADGTYEVTIADAATSEVRVEFITPTTGPEAALEPSFDAGSGAGTAGTTVQFVSIGATDVDLGLLYPGEYCQANPNIATSRLCAGVGNPTAPTVLVTRYDGGPYTTAQGFSDLYSNWTATRAGNKSDTGSILGMAWDPASKRIFNSAYIRRMSEMFEQGGTPRPGALFVTTPNGTTATEGTGGSTGLFVDLEALIAGDQFSNSNAAGPGFIPTNAARKIQFAIDGTIDGGADNDGVDSDLVAGQDGVYEEVGKAGIGDIETDGSGRLWVVSLYDKNLYEVPLPANGSAPTTMQSLGDITAGVNCTNGTGRPFSVTHWRGSLYLGVVCDGSGDYDTGNPGAVTDANLSFTVRRYNLDTQSWDTFFGPQSLASVGKGRADDSSSSLATSQVWNAWTDDWVTTSNPQLFGTRPVPMLSDIQFDADGSMIVGFRDRTGDQNALNEQETPVGTSHAYPTLASGDIYRVCRVGTGYTAADYAFEGSSPECTQTVNATGGTEYYTGDKYFTYHYETSVGMLEQVPGFPEVLMNAYDPYDGDGSGKTFYSGGTRYLRNATGTHDGTFPNAGGGTIFYAWDGNSSNPNTEGGFLKVNGMSDVEALCDQAPLQIGNRVWIDENGNGVQDPGEEPVAGVTVRLYDSTGTLVGTAVTNEAGQYLFASNVDEPADGGEEVDDVGGGVVPLESYTIRLDEPTDYAADGPLWRYVLTSTDAEPAAVSTSDFDVIDNDATAEGTGSTFGTDLFPELTVEPHDAGENDHTFDFGFVQAPLVAMGDYTWIDSDRDGVQDEGEPPLAGVTVTLYESDGTTPATDVDGNPAVAVTDAEGYYFIDALYPGEYVAVFELPVGYVFTTDLSADGTSATDSNPDPATGVTPAFTIAGSETGDTVVDDDPDTRAVFVNPTIDAGVIRPLVAMGNYTWYDLNADGLQGADEPVLEGVTVTLFESDGSTPATDVDGNPATAVTDADGYYFIDALLPGDYVAVFELPEGLVGWAFTAQQTGDVTLDSNPDPSTGVTPVFTIAPEVAGETVVDDDPDTRAVFVNPTIDAGVVPLVAVGDYTWVDTDGNGLQDEGEETLAGVSVVLELPDGTPAVDAAGNPAEAVTDADGYYFLDGLLPGEYVMRFTIPEGYMFTASVAGDAAADSNPFPVDAEPLVGRTASFILQPVEDGQMVVDTDEATVALYVDPTIDAGVLLNTPPSPSVPPIPPPGHLPSTGFGSGALALLALGLLAVGVATVVSVRRRSVVDLVAISGLPPRGT